MNRETWLNELAALMAPRFEELGHPLPAYRVSVGFPSAGMSSQAIGECWDARASGDGRFEIFIRPDKADAVTVAFILAHELIHAAVGLQHGHKGDFAKVALALGFPRPLTRIAPPTPALLAWLEPMLATVGPMPHSPLTWRQEGARVAQRKGGGVVVPERPQDGQEGGQDADQGQDGEMPSSRPPKQTTRLHKAACADCGYTVRVTSKWLEVGRPHCPNHGPMEVAA